LSTVNQYPFAVVRFRGLRRLTTVSHYPLTGESLPLSIWNKKDLVVARRLPVEKRDALCPQSALGLLPPIFLGALGSQGEDRRPTARLDD